MRLTMTVLFVLLVAAATAASSLAMSHEEDGKQMEHGTDHAAMKHGNMSDMQSLGECMRDDVHSTASIKAYPAGTIASMAKMGMDATHHFMIFFTDMAGSEIKDGLVAVKVTNPAGETSAPVKLMSMGAGFGADIVMPEKGEYQLEVGTKLADGKKRVFEYSYANN